MFSHLIYFENNVTAGTENFGLVLVIVEFSCHPVFFFSTREFCDFLRLVPIGYIKSSKFKFYA